MQFYHDGIDRNEDYYRSMVEPKELVYQYRNFLTLKIKRGDWDSKYLRSVLCNHTKTTRAAPSL